MYRPNDPNSYARDMLRESPFAIDRQLDDRTDIINRNKNLQLTLKTKNDMAKESALLHRKVLKPEKMKARLITKIVREATGQHTYFMPSSAILNNSATLSSSYSGNMTTNTKGTTTGAGFTIKNRKKLTNSNVDEDSPLFQPYIKESQLAPQMVSFGHRPRSASRLFNPGTMKIHLNHGEYVPVPSNPEQITFGISSNMLAKLLQSPSPSSLSKTVNSSNELTQSALNDLFFDSVNNDILAEQEEDLDPYERSDSFIASPSSILRDTATGASANTSAVFRDNAGTGVNVNTSYTERHNTAASSSSSSLFGLPDTPLASLEYTTRPVTAEFIHSFYNGNNITNSSNKQSSSKTSPYLVKSHTASSFRSIQINKSNKQSSTAASADDYSATWDDDEKAFEFYSNNLEPLPRTLPQSLTQTLPQPLPHWDTTIVKVSSHQQREFNRNSSMLISPRVIDYNTVNSKRALPKKT